MRPTHRPAAVSMGRVAAGSSLAAIVPRDGAAPVGSESECVHSAFSQGISGSGSDGAGTTRSSQGREGDRPLRCHMDGDTTRGCAARAGPAAHTSRRWDRGAGGAHQLREEDVPSSSRAALGPGTSTLRHLPLRLLHGNGSLHERTGARRRRPRNRRCAASHAMGEPPRCASTAEGD